MSVSAAYPAILLILAILIMVRVVESITTFVVLEVPKIWMFCRLTPNVEASRQLRRVAPHDLLAELPGSLPESTTLLSELRVRLEGIRKS